MEHFRICIATARMGGDTDMKTKDHYELARLMSEPLNISGSKKAAFCCGNIEPDFNRFSYLGKNREHFANGHSYQCRKRQIIAFMEKPCTGTVLWWYRAGKAFHYLTDSFSRPHNPEFRYSSTTHIKYEMGLHDIMHRALKGNPWKIPKVDRDLRTWLEIRHAQYMDRTKGVQDDCYYIYTSVMAVWNWMVDEKLG